VLKQALQSGQITEARVDQAVARILMMKLTYGMTK
jgi:beta-glucosidase-like glycosyl hydrolase